MKNEIVLAQKIKQKQITIQQLKSIEILSISIIELFKKVENEIENNPILELQFNNYNKNNLIQDNNYDIFENIPDKRLEKNNIEEDVFSQINSLNFTEKEKLIAIKIIENLNGRGFLQCNLKDIKRSLNNVKIPDIRYVIENIQLYIHPIGIGSKNTQEYLLIKTKAIKNKNIRIIRNIIKNHFDKFIKNRIKIISLSLNLSINDTIELIDFIKKLGSSPYIQEEQNTIDEIIPEISIYKLNDKYTYELNKFYELKIGFIDKYLKIFNNPTTEQNTKKYIKDQINKGKILIDSIKKRKNTIKKIIDLIINYQKQFLDKGTHHIRSLSAKKISKEINVHETTFNRAIRDKYIKTPHGIFNIKIFFESGYKQKIKYNIEKITEIEDKKTPHTDNTIKNIINRSIKLNVNRRTITKYRNELGISSYSIRKKYSK